MRKKRFKPYQQGQLDGFCGLYSLVNALRYLDVVKTRSAAQALLTELCDVLESKCSLVETLEEGTSASEMTLVFKKVVESKYCVKRYKPFHGVTSKTSMANYVSKLRQFLASENGVVFIGLGGFHDHWTVITAVTEKSFLFCDSDGISRIAIHRCRLSEDSNSASRTHILYPYSTHFLWVD